MCRTGDPNFKVLFGGSIDVEPDPNGHGGTMRIRLPLDNGDDAR